MSSICLLALVRRVTAHVVMHIERMCVLDRDGYKKQLEALQ